MTSMVTKFYNENMQVIKTSFCFQYDRGKKRCTCTLCKFLHQKTIHIKTLKVTDLEDSVPKVDRESNHT